MADASQSKAAKLERRVQQRGERESVIKEQRERFRKRERNKRILNYTILAVIAIALAYGAYVYLVPEAGMHDAFARCLTQKGLVMYGTEWCPHCQEQKQLFGPSFKYVTYVNCDLQPDACNAANVTTYPTWVYPEGPVTEGTQPLSALADRASCPLG